MKLVLENIVKKYENNSVLNGLSYTFEKGKIYGLLGRNGAGKTTLFNCLNSDINLTEGTFYLSDGKQNQKIETEDIGYVLSTPNVPEFLTGYEFLKFFIDINKDKIVDLKTIDEYFDLVKLTKEDQNKLLKDYSHGMKNKMQLLINIIVKPFILLLDEPLTSFDVVVAEEMKNVLKQLKKNRILIFSTHIMELALDLCDEIVVLNKGLLEHIDRKNLNNEELKEKIIEALREE